MRASQVLLLFLTTNMGAANPVPEEKTNATSPAPLSKPVFLCNDNDLAKKCMGAPYNFRCDISGNVVYDVPDFQCRDRAKCRCEKPCDNPRIC
ncbi:uncharacterized protein E0L32_004024 [Thyridium curvatum]|uniref:Trypsin inhibitor n=1 Tax=Thyridium curvatum TaxID=1093900 RepID=A0A507AZV6_9PEZI|nr:uncharacterized protein E0L32_004024 [Thyridium curvatum]TPX16375.1 hypothetical protein E0L32_004024 [Thyridium curvatum]